MVNIERFKPFKFNKNNWSQEDYDNKIMHGQVNKWLPKGTRDAELEEVIKYLDKRRNVIDVGSRFGSYTRSCHTYGFKHVYAFELMTEFMEHYSKNIDLTRATVWNYPVLDKVDNFISSGKRIILTKGNTTTCNIDEFNFTEVDLLKIDIDSHDHLVLKGSYNTIKRNRPIVQMEWGPLQMRQNPNIFEDQAWEYIKDLEYVHVETTTNDNLVLVPREKLID